MKHSIKILGSSCDVNNMYLEYVRKMAIEMHLDFEIEKIESEVEISSYGVTLNCAFGLCPGCRSNNIEPSALNTPALVIDGLLKYVNHVPNDSDLRSILKALG